MIISKASNFTTHKPLSPLHTPKWALLKSPHSHLFMVFSSSSSAAADGPRWNQCHHFSGSNQNDAVYKKPKNAEEAEEEIEERRVSCEVDTISWRERRVKAEISVNADVESVWNALTDYERLSDFIPNLVSRVVMVVSSTFPWWMGDFKKFEGKWSVKYWTRSSSTILSYEVNVIPKFNFPAIFLERIIRSDLPINLQALACRSETAFEGGQKIAIEQSSIPSMTNGVTSSLQKHVDGSLCEKDFPLNEFKENLPGSTSSTLAPATTELNSNWGVFGKVCRLDKPCLVDEENGGDHRGVVASITVKAPVRKVWDVLTAYEILPEIVPNLAISRILSRGNNKVRILQEGCKGLLYVVLHACVVLDLCEQLEQEISFEQVEGDFDSFRGKWILEQLESHHTLLKYTVESKMRKDTFLSEAIMEEVIYEDLPSNLCTIRDCIEEREVAKTSKVCDDEVHMEEQTASSSTDHSDDGCITDDQCSYSNAKSLSRQKPRVPGLQRDIEVLKAELLKFIAEHGQEGFMPMRKQLRLRGRVDIEKAITRMGGFRKIATLMNLSLAYKHRKPKGYWDSLENLQEEISRFQRSWGMDPSYMPSRKSFERAGRYDIARAPEKWGGLHEVSRLLSLNVRHPNRRLNQARDVKSGNVVSSKVKGAKDAPSNPYVSQDTQKWISELKHLDMNWVE